MKRQNVFSPKFPASYSPQHKPSLACLYNVPQINIRKHVHIQVKDDVTPLDSPRQPEFKPKKMQVNNKPQETDIFTPFNKKPKFTREQEPAPFNREESGAMKRVFMKEYDPTKIGALNFPNRHSEYQRQRMPMEHVAPKSNVSIDWDETAKQERKPWRKILSLESQKAVFMPFDKEFGCGDDHPVFNEMHPDQQKCQNVFK
ncbi:Hypothetical_protein [Hexamita inflata]|uniref:Hypothetical_protein n=1 Tax=Hexamita inflata TaxID=28002 RepID=A0AA86R3B0_9EUKA|nr:Hypothetical protein HINF_LOCUS57365 [Hexamita inflata]